MMPVDDTAAAVIGTKLDLLKEDIGRRLDDHRDDIRSMRSEMASNYVNQQAYQAEYGRMADRIQNVESDVVEIRTSLATQFIDVHGHIDRRTGEIGEQVKQRLDEFGQQIKDLRDARRFTVTQLVLIGLALLGSVTAVSVAFIPH
jgi:hypothetical protein